MKTALLLLAAFSAPAWADDEVIPVSYAKERYTAMAALSPFKLATPPPPPPEDKPNPFANVYLRGLGSNYVVIQRVGDDHTIRITGNETSPEGFAVQAVHWSDVPGASTVDVTKDGQSGLLEFNKNELLSAAKGANLPKTARPIPKGPSVAGLPKNAPFAPPAASKFGSTYGGTKFNGAAKVSAQPQGYAAPKPTSTGQSTAKKPGERQRIRNR